MQYILALDQGTTSSRALIIDEQGKVVTLCQKEFPQHFPKPGWVEHDAEDIWQSILSVTQEVLQKVDIQKVCTCGITNQRETTVVWNRKTGKAVSPVIVWQDRRTANYCRLLKDRGMEKVVQKKTGLLLDPYFSGTKLKWILDNISTPKEDLAFGTIDTWLIWNLTKGKEHLTDATNASRTLLCNITHGNWDEELLSMFSIPKTLLPEIRDSSGDFGKIDAGFFGKEIPIQGVAGDQQAALFGQSCQENMIKITYGTGCFILMHTGTHLPPTKNRLLTTIANQLNGKREYAIEGSVFMGGAVVQWLKDSLSILKTSSEIEDLAQKVEDSGGIYFVPAFTGLGAPYWDPNTKGTIFGLTRGSTKEHLARAALEGIAFQVTDVIHAMQEDAESVISSIRVDGGAISNDLLMQIQSNFLNIPLQRPINKEVTALGAAYLAGLASGIWKNREDLQKLWKQEQEFHPTIAEEEREEKRIKWRHAIFCAQKWQE